MSVPMAAAMMAMTAITNISAGVTNRAQINASNTINAANAYANNLVRAANNELRSSRASLSRYVQGENNARVLENTGAALEASAINYRRARDSATGDDFENQIAFSEQAGAQAAAAALSGLTGGVADMVNGTTALRKARLQQRADQAMKQGDWDAAQRNRQIAQAGWDSLDQSEIAPDLDYSVDIAAKQQVTGGFLTEILGGQSAQNMANVFNFTTSSPNAFADRAGAQGSGSGDYSRTITGGR